MKLYLHKDGCNGSKLAQKIVKEIEMSDIEIKFEIYFIEDIMNDIKDDTQIPEWLNGTPTLIVTQSGNNISFKGTDCLIHMYQLFTSELMKKPKTKDPILDERNKIIETIKDSEQKVISDGEIQKIIEMRNNNSMTVQE